MKLKIMQKSILLCVIYSMATGSPSPKEIVKKAEEKMRGDTAHAIVTMTVEKIKLKRSMQVEYFDHRLENKMFIRMLAPKKDQGITFLKLKENLWQYLPSIGKEIKIEASFMQDAWMGSDFSNDDLVRNLHLKKIMNILLLQQKRKNFMPFNLFQNQVPQWYGQELLSIMIRKVICR